MSTTYGDGCNADSSKVEGTEDLDVPTVTINNLEVNTSVRTVVKWPGTCKITVEAENSDHANSVDNSDTGISTNKKSTVVLYTH